MKEAQPVIYLHLGHYMCSTRVDRIMREVIRDIVKVVPIVEKTREIRLS